MNKEEWDAGKKQQGPFGKSRGGYRNFAAITDCASYLTLIDSNYTWLLVLCLDGQR